MDEEQDRARLQELVAYLAKALVDHPEEVTVDVADEDRAWLFELTVDEADLGKVIGKEGRTARALRTVLAAAAAKVERRAILEILE